MVEVIILLKPVMFTNAHLCCSLKETFWYTFCYSFLDKHLNISGETEWPFHVLKNYGIFKHGLREEKVLWGLYIQISSSGFWVTTKKRHHTQQINMTQK